MNYRYVIGLQLEVSEHDSVEATNTAYKNEKLMTLLPKFFYDNAAEEAEADTEEQVYINIAQEGKAAASGVHK